MGGSRGVDSGVWTPLPLEKSLVAVGGLKNSGRDLPLLEGGPYGPMKYVDVQKKDVVRTHLMEFSGSVLEFNHYFYFRK